jgi:diguanylate cyclase (GGDEF)-like protein
MTRIPLGQPDGSAPSDVAEWRSRPSSYLIVCGILLIAAIAVCTTIMIMNFRDRALADSERELKNTALILAGQVDRYFQELDLVAGHVNDEIRSLEVPTSEDFKRRLSGLSTHLMLSTSTRGSSQFEALTLVDAAGNLINSSRDLPIPNVNVADRDYFKLLRANVSQTALLSLPVQNRGFGIWTLYYARRIDTSNGEFLGLISAAIEMAYFEKIFAAVDLGEGSSISLSRSDGILLARYPRVEAAVGKYLGHQVDALGSRDSGTSRFVGTLTGTDRMLAANRLAHFPLILTVALDRKTALADWRAQTTAILGAAGVAIFVIIGMFFVVIRQIATTHKISNQKLALEKHRLDIAVSNMSYLAHHDALTGLPNRVLFRELLEVALIRVNRGEQIAVLFLDLDHFKAVNDSLGHPVGDELLKCVAEKLSGCLKEKDVCAHLGGDEFAIILNSISVAGDVIDLITRIHSALRTGFDAGGHQLFADASIGIALSPTDGVDPDQLLKNADLAMYSAKADGRGTARFFKPDMDTRVKARHALETDLREATYRSEFELHYQPLVDLQNNKIVGCEALLRWRHPTGGMISPADFVPIAEDTGLIGPIGEWVLMAGCAEAATWPSELKIAINVSPVQFNKGGFVQAVLRALAASGLQPNRLELEITEAVLIRDDAAALAVLLQLKTLGVRIALDDFGTGYSSLSYLQRFPFDKIKIDRSFIKHLGESVDSLSIVQAVVSIAKTRNITTTAEGVETEQQRQVLRKVGCTEMQGYLFSPPVPADKIAKLILSRWRPVLVA